MQTISIDRAATAVRGPLQRLEPAEARLLVIASDTDMAAFKKALSGENWDIEQARSSAEAEKTMAVCHYDAILLDAGLYAKGDWSFLTVAGTPTILVSQPAARHEFATILALRPADFLFRPFHAPELVVRIKKVLGRVPARSSLFQTANFALDAEQRQCRIYDRQIRLTAHETAFLSALLNTPRQFLGYGQLIEKIWGSVRAVETQNLRVLAVQLRKKIEPQGDAPSILITVTGVGYRLQLP